MSNPVFTSLTFLLTDVEGSTRLFEKHEHLMYSVMARHDALAAEALAAHQGRIIKPRGEGDSLFIVFETAQAAVAGALALQKSFHTEPWPAETPIRARMAVHTGEAEFREDNYYGPVVNRCARLRTIAHGGQTLVSEATRKITETALPDGCALRDMGPQRLKDLEREEQVFQLLHPDLPADFPPLLSLNRHQHNLPVQWKRFIGRETELREISEILETSPLLTLTGPGGAGKTRLALQAAAEQIENFEDGARFIKLDRMTESEGSLIPQAIATEAGVSLEPGSSPVDALCDALQAKDLLLILDNCEHLLPDCKAVAAALLDGCPHLKILATSHAPLGLSGEQQYPISSLGLPVSNLLRPAMLTALQESAAAQLFIECSRRAKPNFAVTERNARLIAQICEQLDGIPLLIELAAARVKSLSLDSIARQLQSLLTGGDAQGTQGRHQSAESVIRWSYDLLAEKNRRLLRRLSVFAGGFTLEAAQAVCADEREAPEAVLTNLLLLADRSLVLTEEDAEGAYRYRLLRVIRDYAQTRLYESGEAETVAERHQDYFLALAEEAEPYLQGPEQAEWFNRLDREQDNFRAALKWSADGEARLRMAGALYGFWRTRAYTQEGRRWLADALAQTPDAAPDLRLKALNGAGVLAYIQNDYTDALTHFSQALEIARSQQNERSIARQTSNLGLAIMETSTPQEARPLFEESLNLYNALQEEAKSVAVLNSLGMIAYRENNFLEARNYFRNCAFLYRRIDNKWAFAIALHNSGDASYKLGDYSEAESLHQQSLAMRFELKDYVGMVHCLFNLADATAASGRLRRAALLFAIAERIGAAMNITLLSPAREDYAAKQTNLRKAVGEELYTGLQRQGEDLSLEKAIEFALGAAAQDSAAS